MTMALDLILKSFMSSKEFNNMPDKDWNAISKLIPGTTPKQCQKRYDELLKEYLSDVAILTVNSIPKGSVMNNGIIKSGRTDEQVNQKSSRPGSAKPKGVKLDKDMSSSKSEQKRPDSGEQSEPQVFMKRRKPKYNPVMVIHVCDEGKNLKQDFHCARDMLVNEMRYFAEYLSTDTQRWEDVDISVHCDVQIFDWLMKYVKRHTRDVTTPPKLEPSNVISILISSDFLKMDSLVQWCIEYAHQNMNAIIATPCNMNCINDKLVARIADLFTHNEADEIKDRKDKFKSKLFSKKLERLFDPEYDNPDSPENASTMYRCNICKKIMTRNLENKLKCLQSRMTIDYKGHLTYSHVKDKSWDLNDYLIELKSQLKTWRDVYWRVWGMINYLTCSRCGETFPCSELSHCKYHLEMVQFGGVSMNTDGSSALGLYSCCGQKVLRFDPTQSNVGCKVRDHVVNLEKSEGKEKGESEDINGAKNKVYNDLLAHKDTVTVPYPRLISGSAEDLELNIFRQSEKPGGLKTGVTKSSKSDSSLSDDNNKPEVTSQPRLHALTVEREVSYDEDVGIGESEDELGDEEDGQTRKFKGPRRSRVTVDPQAILLGAPNFNTTKSRKWDSTRSMRWNQDAQREEDQRRMNDIITYLTRLRLNKEKLERLKQKEYAGGIFAKLEAQWKGVNIPPPKPVGSLSRSKTRSTPMKL